MAAPTNQEILDAFKAALLAIATGGQSYSINGRTLTRANLPEIRATIREYEQKVADEDPDSGGGFAYARFN